MDDGDPRAAPDDDAPPSSGENQGANPSPGEVPEAPRPPSLRQRTLGRSGGLVSEFTLGTWGLSGEASGPVYRLEVDRIISRAMEAGITLYDTADFYDGGDLQEKLGHRLDAEHRICTRIGTFPRDRPPRKHFAPRRLAEALDVCHERQNRSCLDVVLLHNPSVTALEGDAPDFMRERVDAGEVGVWGVSCGDADVAEKAIEVGASVVMLAFNVLHQSDFRRVAEAVEATETGVMARSVLAHGLLTGHWSRNKIFFDYDHRQQRWTRETLKYRLGQLDACRHLVDDTATTLRAVALRFVLHHHLVSTAVLGPRSLTQLNQLLLEAGHGPPYLNGEGLEALPARLAAVGAMSTAS
ncbi:MAG: aldo/keto reductase [Myxococcota bacterium]